MNSFRSKNSVKNEICGNYLSFLLFPNSKRNSFRGNYMEKCGNLMFVPDSRVMSTNTASLQHKIQEWTWILCPNQLHNCFYLFLQASIMKSLILVLTLALIATNTLTPVESASHFFTRESLMSALLKRHLERQFPELYKNHANLFTMKRYNYIYDYWLW